MIGPEHAWLHDRNRAEYVAASDAEALDAARRLSPHRRHSSRRSNARTRWPKPSSARPAAKGKIFIVNLSGRGDKDIDIYRENFPELDQPMTRIGRLFERLKQENRKGLIAYLTAGDPSPRPHSRPGGGAGARRRRPDRTRRAVLRSDRRWPGDPARRRARAQGGHHAGDACSRSRGRFARRSEVPLLLFTYLNPVLRYGLERLARGCGGGRHRWLPADRCQRGRGGDVRDGHAPPRAGHGLSGRADQHGATPQTGGASTPRVSSIWFRAPASPASRIRSRRRGPAG